MIAPLSHIRSPVEEWCLCGLPMRKAAPTGENSERCLDCAVLAQTRHPRRAMWFWPRGPDTDEARIRFLNRADRAWEVLR